MTTAKLIATLGAAGVQLWLDEEGQLRFKAPKGALTPELKQALVDAKQEVIDFLKTTQVKPETRIAPLPRVGNERLALSFAQQRLWFLDRLDPGNPSLHITAAIRISGALDIATMQRALEQLVARHESLRTTRSARSCCRHRNGHCPKITICRGLPPTNSRNAFVKSLPMKRCAPST
jgi:hypothetical protein